MTSSQTPDQQGIGSSYSPQMDRGKSQQALTLYFSYAIEDEKLVKELKKYLRHLERQNRIAIWLSRDLDGGKEIDREITSHLNQARVILLLISHDFIASDYYWKAEVEPALQKHDSEGTCVIPILLRPIDDLDDLPFSKLQILPKNKQAITSWAKRDEAFSAVAQGIREAIESLSPHRSIELHVDEPKQFYGRESEIERAKQILLEEKLPLLVHGFPGIGKSTFISKLVNIDEVKKYFKEDIIGLQLNENSTLDGIVADIARWSGATHILDWKDLNIRMAHLKQVLLEKHPNHLIFLDNVDENIQIDHITDFRNKASHRIIVGSRSESRLWPLEGSSLEISDLDLDAALRLFAHHAKIDENSELTEDQKQRMTAICELLNNHPHAIVLAAGMLAQPDITIDALKRDLDIEMFKIGGGTQRGTSIRASFNVSYNQLLDYEKSVFDACGIFALSGATADAIDAVTNLNSPTKYRLALRALDSRSLIEYDPHPQVQWVHMHPLMHAYARDRLMEREKDAALKNTVMGRMISYYVEYARNNKQSSTLLDAERDNLLQAAQWAHDKEDWIAIHDLWKSLDEWLDSIGDRKNQEQLLKWAVKANELLGRPAELSDVLREWSDFLSVIDRPDEAKQAAEKSLELAHQSQDPRLLAMALAQLGQVLQTINEGTKGHKLFEEAWTICCDIQDWDEVAYVAYRLAGSYQDQGNLTLALEWFQKNLEIARQTGSLLYEAYALTSIGNWYAGQDQLEEARKYLQDSLDIKEKLKNKYSIAIALRALAHVEVKRNNLLIARELFNRAISLHKEISAYIAQVWTFVDIGDTFAKEQKQDEALAYYDQAMEASSKLISKEQRSTELRRIGAAYARLKQLDRAEQCYMAALTLCQSLPGNHSYQLASIHQAMGDLYQLQEKFPEAQLQHRQARRYYEQANEEIQEQSTVILILRSLREIIIAEGDYDALDQYVEQEVQLHIDQGNQKQAKVVLFNAGKGIYDQLQLQEGASVMLAVYQQAQRYLERSLAIDEELQDYPGIIATLSMLIDVTIAEDDYSKVGKYMEQEVSLLIAQGETKQASAVLFNTAHKIYDRVKKQERTATTLAVYQQARHYIERSLEVAQGLVNDTETVIILEALIEVLVAQGDYGTVDAYMEQVINLLIQQERQKQASIILFSTGREIYEQLKKQDISPSVLALYQQTRHYIERSLEIAQGLMANAETTTVLEALIDILVAQGDYGTIDPYMEQVINLLIQQERQKQASVVLFNTAREMYDQLREQHEPLATKELYQQARRYIERSMEIGQGLLSDAEIVVVLKALIDVIITEGAYEALDQHVEQVHSLLIAQGEHKQASAFLYRIGRRIFEQQMKQDESKDEEEKGGDKNADEETDKSEEDEEKNQENGENKPADEGE